MTENKRLITFIIPAYNEENNIRRFYTETNKIVTSLNSYICEFVFIDDGSNDSTWQVIKEISDLNSIVKGLRLSRNFGKEMALTAGIIEWAKSSEA